MIETLRKIETYLPTRAEFSPGFTPAMVNCAGRFIDHYVMGMTCSHGCGFVNTCKPAKGRKKGAK